MLAEVKRFFWPDSDEDTWLVVAGLGALALATVGGGALLDAYGTSGALSASGNVAIALTTPWFAFSLTRSSDVVFASRLERHNRIRNGKIEQKEMDANPGWVEGKKREWIEQIRASKITESEEWVASADVGHKRIIIAQAAIVSVASLISAIA